MSSENQAEHHTPVPKPVPWYKTPRAKNAGLLTGLAVVLGIVYLFLFVFPYVSTDDARINARLVRLAPQGMGGRVIAVNVDEGDRVKRDQVLIELDHAQAQADLSQAQAKASVTAADWERAQKLFKQRAISARSYQMAQATYQEAQASLQMAQIELDNTYLKSPFDGVVVLRTVEVGNILERSQTALTLADIDHAWVAANVEETSINPVKLGQKAVIKIDAGGELTGVVSEITSASESQFSLIPMENPSGNFIKLVQRIPIKIQLDGHGNVPLRVGESVVIKIKVH